MAKISPFKALRPAAEHAPKVASRPYDVLNSKEAKTEAQGNSLFIFTRYKKRNRPPGKCRHSQHRSVRKSKAESTCIYSTQHSFQRK